MRSTVVVAMALVLLVGLAGCGPSQEEQMAAESAAQLEQLQEAKAALEAKRQELADLRAQIAGADDSAEGAEEMKADLEASIATLGEEIAEQSDQFSSAVVDFINADPPIEGEPLSETQLTAIRLKSAEDIIVAGEHISKGGDYCRAIDIYNQALMVDPDNEALKAALAVAEENRYMTEERFSQVTNGMTEGEVRDLLGQPNLRNVRDYEDRGVTAWFYPINEAGDAAAVWFRAKDDGSLKVYQAKYEAVTRDEQGP